MIPHTQTQTPLPDNEWLRPLPAGVQPTRLPPTGKRGRPPTDNDALAELRARYHHLDTGTPSEFHKKIAETVMGAFCDAWCRHLGVAAVDPDPATVRKFVWQGKPDELVAALRTATARQKAQARPAGTCADCGQPRDHDDDRTYCRACKAKRNTAENRRRKEAAASGQVPVKRLPNLGTYEEFCARG